MFSFDRYVKHHYIHQLNQTPNYDYLGHPVNAYHLIRHVASGWDNILNNVMSDDIFSLVHDLGMHSIVYISYILTIDIFRFLIFGILDILDIDRFREA